MHAFRDPPGYARDNNVLHNGAYFFRINDCPASWICFLPPQSNWLIYGWARFTILIGHDVRVFGAYLKNNFPLSLNVYSSAMHVPIDVSIHSPENLSNISLLDIVSTLKQRLEIPSENLEILLNNFSSQFSDMSGYGTVCLLECLPCPIIESIRLVPRLGRHFSSPNLLHIPEKLAIHGENYSLQSASDCDGFIECVEISRLMEKLMSDNVLRNCKILLCGPSNSGKSTILRRLVNCLLSSGNFEAVLILDCDPGQTEFTPPGILSLSLIKEFILGPPFSHPLHGDFKPIRQCFFGGTSPSVDPTFYVNCLRYVFGQNNNCYPLIVNTMGWTQGLGLTLLIDQIVMTRPDIIIQFYQDGSRSNHRLNLPPLTSDFLRNSVGWNSLDLSAETFNHEIIQVPSKSQCGPGGFTSSQDHRDVTLLSHLLSGLVDAETSLPGSGKHGRGFLPLGHPGTHLRDCLPYRVSLIGSKGEVALAVHILHPSSGTSDAILAGTSTLYSLPTLASCLNATLVALCIVPPETIIPPTQDGDLTLLSHASACECVGLAFVRALESTSGVIYLTTGVPIEKLTKVNAIIRGKVDLPQSLFTEQPFTVEARLSYSSDEQAPRPPYLGLAYTSGAGRSGLSSRRYHPRVVHHPQSFPRHTSEF